MRNQSLLLMKMSEENKTEQLKPQIFSESEVEKLFKMDYSEKELFRKSLWQKEISLSFSAFKLLE